MAAGSLKKLGTFFTAPGYTTELMYVYLATDLSPAPLEGDEDEVLHVEHFSLEQAYQMAEDGHIQDAKTLAALFLAHPHLEASASHSTSQSPSPVV